MDYEYKYLKYKNKYINLIGGVIPSDDKLILLTNNRKYYCDLEIEFINLSNDKKRKKENLINELNTYYYNTMIIYDSTSTSTKSKFIFNPIFDCDNFIIYWVDNNLNSQRIRDTGYITNNNICIKIYKEYKINNIDIINNIIDIKNNLVLLFSKINYLTYNPLIIFREIKITANPKFIYIRNEYNLHEYYNILKIEIVDNDDIYKKTKDEFNETKIKEYNIKNNRDYLSFIFDNTNTDKCIQIDNLEIYEFFIITVYLLL